MGSGYSDVQQDRYQSGSVEPVVPVPSIQLPPIVDDAPVAIDFAIGDEIQLKSGSPAMTVRAIDGDYITCDYFTDKGQDLREMYHKNEIEKVPAT